MAKDRWQQFSIDYPEIFAYLLGQVSSKFTADHRLMDLITLVNLIEPDSIPALKTDSVVSEPQPASEQTGYRGMSRDDYSYIYRDDELLFIGVLTENSVINLLRTETSALRAELQAARDDNKVHREHIEDLRTENLRRTREVDTMQDSLDDTEHMVNEARQERDSLRLELEKAIQERDATRTLYDGKHERLEEVQHELQAARQQIEDLYRVIDDAHTLAIDIGDTDHHQDGRLHNVGMLMDFLESHLKDSD